jgi:hypothetical protein
MSDISDLSGLDFRPLRGRAGYRGSGYRGVYRGPRGVNRGDRGSYRGGGERIQYRGVERINSFRGVDYRSRGDYIRPNNF